MEVSILIASMSNEGSGEYAQTHQSLRRSHERSTDVDEGSDQTLYLYIRWIHRQGRLLEYLPICDKSSKSYRLSIFCSNLSFAHQ